MSKNNLTDKMNEIIALYEKEKQMRVDLLNFRISGMKKITNILKDINEDNPIEEVTNQMNTMMAQLNFSGEKSFTEQESDIEGVESEIDDRFREFGEMLRAFAEKLAK